MRVISAKQLYASPALLKGDGDVQRPTGDRLLSPRRLEEALGRDRQEGDDQSQDWWDVFTQREHVSGINVDLVPGQRIVQAWRHQRFPEGILSMAAVAITPTTYGGTELVLTHRGVPKDLIPETELA